jgi:acyl-CoA synthetase (AMP-forming)/AMP-acid ligase II
VRADALLEHAAERLPSKTAIVCGAERQSYAELNGRANRTANALVAAGVMPGDRVVLDLGNSIETVASWFGVLKAGAVAVIVHPHARLDYVRGIVADCGARLVLSREHGVPASSDAADPPKRHADQDLAALVYTSGSTGHPKGVMLTHANLTWAAAAIGGYLELTADDVILNALPLAFTYGLGQITTACHAGATVVLAPSMTYPREILDLMIREGVTGLPLVPTMAALLTRQNLTGLSFPKLRYITNAAAPLSTSAIGRLRDAFPGARLYLMYGQTECQRVSFLPPEQLDTRPDSVGRPIRGTSAWVVDEQGLPVPPGVVGELVVRGPHVMKGYWNHPEPDGPVLHTGDQFRQDAEGFLYFVSRSDDVIKTRGEKVAPRAVEEVIAQMPGVDDVCVFGVPDDVLGEAVAAVIKPAAGAALDPDRVRRHCLQRLDAFMVPKTVEIRDALPTTTTGKVSRRLLRAAALQGGRACA